MSTKNAAFLVDINRAVDVFSKVCAFFRLLLNIKTDSFLLRGGVKKMQGYLLDPAY